MSAIQIAANDFGFGNDATHWLASMKYWGLRAEGKQSVSYSRLRRHFKQLHKDNEEMKHQLEEAIRLSQVYARKRIDSEAERSKSRRKWNLLSR